MEKQFEYFSLIDFSMPGTFQMVPLKVSVLDINGVQTYFFKVGNARDQHVLILK